MRDGTPCYATAVAETDVTDGWREHRREGGRVIDVGSGDVVLRGLSMPHSPRLFDATLYVLDSGTGHFCKADLVRGAFEPICFCPGYLRGLSFAGGRFAVVGLSRLRPEVKTFSGLPLSESLAAKGVAARCGMMIIDLKSGDTVHWLNIKGVVEELYDVAVLPDVIRPMAIGFKSDEIRRVLTIEDCKTAMMRSGQETRRSALIARGELSSEIRCSATVRPRG
jgi:uncharacterized protein (TIGR03032 family)